MFDYFITLCCLQIRFEYIRMCQEKKRGTKKSTSGADTKEEAHGILEGISSLHSWIKTQTMIRPHQKGRGGKQGAMYDEVRFIVNEIEISEICLKSLWNQV